MYLIINKWVIAVKVSKFSGQYLRNHRTLDIGVLGYIGIVWPKEHSPEVRSFPPGTPYIYIYIWENAEKYCMAGQVKDDNTGHAPCMLDTWGYKYTHSGCVILAAFPQQQRLHECALLLHCTYNACLVHIQSCTQATVPRGLCSASHVYSSDSWRTVSRVGTTTSGAATLCVSTSIWGTLLDHGHHSRVVILTYITVSNKRLY